MTAPRKFRRLSLFVFTLLTVSTLHAQTELSSGLVGGTYGFAVASAGDLNGDGHDELIIGARFESVDLGMGLESQVGRVYVYSGVDLSVLHVFEGTQAPGAFGWAVAGGGDFNGDGTPDIAIGAPSNNGFAGEAFIYSGVTTGPNAWELLHSVQGGAANDSAGSSIAFVGNLPRDETSGPDVYDDVAIGVPDANFGAGRVIVSGLKVVPDPMMPGNTLIEVEDTIITSSSPVSLPPLGFGSARGLGECVASAGDYDGDGTVDLAIGAPASGNNFNRHGRAMVYSGAGLLTGASSLLLDVVGDSADNLGQGLASAGLFTGDDGDPMTDDLPSLAVGAPHAPSGSNNNGALLIYRYNTVAGASELVLRVDSPDAARTLGSVVAPAGDLNGDGFDDIMTGGGNAVADNSVVIAGGPADPDGPGPLTIGASIDFLSLGSRLLYEARPLFPNAALGRGFLGGFDTDNDGHPDMIISDPNAGGAGVSYLYEAKPRDVAVTNPTSGAIVSGAAVPLEATAANTDEVQWLLDGGALGAPLSAEPFATTFDSTLVSDGAHSLRVEAAHTSIFGVLSTAGSIEVPIIVDNTGPVMALTAPLDGALVTGTIDITATATDISGVTSVRFLAGTTVDVTLDPAMDPLSVAFDTTAEANGVATITIEAVDTLGHMTTVAIMVNIDNSVFIRGDCNADGLFNIADAVNILNALFGGGAAPLCRDACDANDDEALNVADAVAMLQALFGAVSVPLDPPGPGCGLDPVGAALDCVSFPACP